MAQSDMKAVVDSYEHYKEDFRLKADNSHRLEFLTTITYMDRFLNEGDTLLDVAAGTGAYALRYAARGAEVTALDITPKYVEIMQQKAAAENVKMVSFTNDARDLSAFSDNCFDHVFCMGPLYHLTEEEDRRKVLQECLRVLKPGGMIYIAYINKYYVFADLALGSRRYLKEKWFQRIINEQVIRSEDEDCFWTDAWFTTPSEIEALCKEYRIEKTAHIAQDGLGRLRAEDVNALPQEEFTQWCEFHIRTCEEPSILGVSNHGLFIGRKA